MPTLERPTDEGDVFHLRCPPGRTKRGREILRELGIEPGVVRLSAEPSETERCVRFLLRRVDAEAGGGPGTCTPEQLERLRRHPGVLDALGPDAPPG